eukprot:CAMPEP_0181442408 /NCGR_PEP_ID=MMETSP1110-20121109/24010_1 /TAXON_ID=174948 /ORGANISM="Symbiodinium sp., Strain CCMP421" /LENGTH=135 /DNA_ID=CAMNT_0023566327 /DNA_START=48 /DNA_END=455 /DNA_ORIENTATION=-
MIKRDQKKHSFDSESTCLPDTPPPVPGESFKKALKPYLPRRHTAEAPCERGAWYGWLRPQADSKLLARRRAMQAAAPRTKVMPNLDVDMALMPPVEVPRKRRKWAPLVRRYSATDWPMLEQAMSCWHGLEKSLLG